MPAPRVTASQMIRIQAPKIGGNDQAQRGPRRSSPSGEARTARRRSASPAARRRRAAGNRAPARAFEAGDAGDQQPGDEMGADKQHHGFDEGRNPDHRDQRRQHGQAEHQPLSPQIGIVDAGRRVGKRCRFRLRHRAERHRDQAQHDRQHRLPGGFQPVHAGLPPMARSTMRPAMPTTMTRSAATIEPATSADQMSMDWL